MKWFFNPFERIAGWQALFIGLAAMALTAVVGTINHIAFDGVLDLHSWAEATFSGSFIMQAINFLALFLSMWLAGVCFSKSRLRAIDVAGTMALARAPMLLLAIVLFLPIAPESIFNISHAIIFGLVCAVFSIWMIALIYNAYTVSCHLKGARAVSSFIGALIVAEIISKIVIAFLWSGLLSDVPIKNVFSSDSNENFVVLTNSLTIRQKTENVVKSFESDDFDAITVYFDANMKKNYHPAV